MNYFVYDPYEGVETFDTEEEAIEAAKRKIDGYLDMYEGWLKETNQIVVGKITHRAKKTNICKKVGEVDEDGYDESGQEWLDKFDETCDYEMLPIDQQ